MSEKAPLRIQVKRFMDNQKLDDRQFASLSHKLRQAQSLPAGSQRSLDNRPPYVWAAAASLLVLLSVVFIIHFLVQSDGKADIPHRIAEEVATNHIKIQQLNLEASTLDEIRTSLDRLDFIPAESQLIDHQTYRLKGARYCTMQGMIAAHIIYDSPGGTPMSHYQAAYDPARFGQLPDLSVNDTPRTISIRGVQVQLWVEQGLVMARAHTISDNSTLL